MKLEGEISTVPTKTVDDVLKEILGSKGYAETSEYALGLLTELATAFRQNSCCNTHIFWTRLVAFGDYGGFSKAIELISSAYEDPYKRNRYTQNEICNLVIKIRSLVHKIISPEEKQLQENYISDIKPLFIDLNKIQKLSSKEKEISYKLLENQELCLQLDLIMRIITCKINYSDDINAQELKEKYKNPYNVNYVEDCKLHQAHMQIIHTNQQYNRIVILPPNSKIPDEEEDKKKGKEDTLRSTTLYLLPCQNDKHVQVKAYPPLGNSVNFPSSKFNDILPSVIKKPLEITDTKIIKNVATSFPGITSEYTGKIKTIQQKSGFFNTKESTKEIAEEITISFQREYPVINIKYSTIFTIEPEKNSSESIKFFDKSKEVEPKEKIKASVPLIIMGKKRE